MRLLVRCCLAVLVPWLAATALAVNLLPGQLLQAPLPARSPAEVARRLDQLAERGGAWTEHRVAGGQGVPLRVRWLHRSGSQGVAIFLHGFGDDAFGTVGYARSLPGWDALMFTFRGRDLDPTVPSTLGGWERQDVTAVVAFLESQGVSRNRILLVGVSQGAGVALLALKDLESGGNPLAGALLESPFMDLGDAARNHVRGVLGGFEPLARPAEWLTLRVAGRRAGFDPKEVSPLAASRGLRTPVALLAGDRDTTTPLAGVREIAAHLPDLTVVQGAEHCEAGARVPGGWGAWARERLRRWGHPS